MNNKARHKERRPATAEGEVRRRKILDAATLLFSAGGFNSASIADVAAAVGITQAGVLHYFPSKRELLLAVLRDRHERNELAREEAMAHGEDWLRAFMQTLSANDESPALVQLFAVLSAESITDGHPAQEWFQQHYDRVVSSARDALAEVVDPAALPDGVTVEIMARWFVAVADGWRLQWLHDTTIPTRQESLSLLLEMFVPGLTAASLPDSASARFDHIAKEHGLTRSEFYRRAAEHYANQLDNADLPEQVDDAIDAAGQPDDQTA